MYWLAENSGVMTSSVPTVPVCLKGCVPEDTMTAVYNVWTVYVTDGAGIDGQTAAVIVEAVGANMVWFLRKRDSWKV